MRLEYDPLCFPANAAIDILLVRPSHVAIELKYKTSLLEHEIEGHKFSLKTHSAADQGCYDFWRDVSRIETVVDRGVAEKGYVIFLTNEPGYWKEGRGITGYDDFRVSERRTATGRLEWGGNLSVGTTGARTAPITLRSEYNLKRRDYADLGVRRGLFKCLVLEIARQSR